MKKILAVYDSDIFYITRFMEYFKNKKDFNFEISVFTISESLEAFLQLHKIEILLLGNQMSIEEIPTDNIKYQYRFSEEKNCDQDIGLPCIFKYQPVQQVMEELLEDYSRRQDEVNVDFNSKSINILTVFTPNPGLEERSFAWSMGFQLSKQKKVLMIPLELLPTPSLPFLDSSKQVLTEFVYYLKENLDISRKMKSLLSYSGNLSYLSGIAHGFDLLSLNKEDVRRWVEAIRLHTDYQTVIFYAALYQDASVELMNLSDRVLLPMQKEPYAEAVFQEWENQMERIGVSTQSDKFQTIYLQQEVVGKESYCSLQEFTGCLAWREAADYLSCLE